jgi:T-complex protein 1 subunit eta
MVWQSEKENAEVRINDPDEYQTIVDAEWRIIYEKLEKCVESGASIILSKLPIGDLATQYFADRALFCAGRVASEDLDRVAKATGERGERAGREGAGSNHEQRACDGLW